jgi:hypothetical protein
MSQDLDKIALHQYDLWFLALFALALHSFTPTTGFLV